MHRPRRKCRQTHCYIFRAVGVRRAVLHPLARVRDHSLAGGHIERTVLVADKQRTFQHDSEFIETRCLTRLNPTTRAAHVRDAEPRFSGVHAPDEFINEFRFVPRRGDACWSRDKRWHGPLSLLNRTLPGQMISFVRESKMA